MRTRSIAIGTCSRKYWRGRTSKCWADPQRRLEGIASRYSNSAFDSAGFVPRKCASDIVSYGGAALYLRSCPHTKLQYVLELLRQIVPSVVIAGRVRGKIVIDVVSATGAMCDDVV